MKTLPMEHQTRGLEASARKRNFAFLMEQGTGKTWLTMADAERLFRGGLIDCMLILAPNGVHSNWIRREIPTHMDLPTRCYYWRGTPSSKKAKAELEEFIKPIKVTDGPQPLAVFAINVEAINFKHGYEAVERVLEKYKCLIVMDESTRIKNAKASRSKKAIALSKLATARRILSGTPLTKSPVDLFMQFEFLKPGILGTKSHAAFTAQYAVLLQAGDPQMIAILRNLGGKVRGIPQVVKKDDFGNPMFKNLDRLADLIEPHSFRVRKKDCLDLPDKIYKVVPFELTSEQRAIYEEIKEDYSYVLDNNGIIENMSFEAIAARTKLKQVTSGFINIQGDAILMPAGDNPRMEVFKDLVERLVEQDDSMQVIVWAIYKEEIAQIAKHLESIGLTHAIYNGDTSQSERERIIDEFQAGKIQFFVGHTQAAGIGITLTAAETTIYYTCSEDNELRMQSEDRNHRIGTKNSVVYYDLIGEDTIDIEVQRLLAMKRGLANAVIDRQR